MPSLIRALVWPIFSGAAFLAPHAVFSHTVSCVFFLEVGSIAKTFTVLHSDKGFTLKGHPFSKKVVLCTFVARNLYTMEHVAMITSCVPC